MEFQVPESPKVGSETHANAPIAPETHVYPMKLQNQPLPSQNRSITTNGAEDNACDYAGISAQSETHPHQNSQHNIPSIKNYHPRH